MKTVGNCNHTNTPAKQSLEITKSRDCGSCMKSDMEQNLNTQNDSIKNHSHEVECFEIGLSTGEENDIPEYMVRTDEEIRKAENRTKINSDEDNNLDEETDYSTFSHNLERRDQIKEKGKDSCEEISRKTNENAICRNDLKISHNVCSTISTNFCNNGPTDKTQGGYGSNNENCVSITWEIDGDDLTPKTIENNSVKQNLNKTNISSYYYRLEQTKTDYRHVLYPMDDNYGPFFINRKFVDVDLYQEGLKHKNWNPVQVLHEICTGCDWGLAKFEELDYTKQYGFLFSIKLKGHMFNPKKRGSTKKKAKAFASAFFLQYLGFKFNFENYQVTFASHSVSHTGWHERINTEFFRGNIKDKEELLEDNVKVREELLEDNIKDKTELLPHNIQEDDSFSNELASYWDLRSTFIKTKHSCGSDSENNLQYNKKKVHSSCKIPENQSNEDPDLINQCKQCPCNKLDKISDHSSPCESKRNSKHKRRHSHKSKSKCECEKNHSADLKKKKKRKYKNSSYDELDDSSDYCCFDKQKRKSKNMKSHSLKSGKISKHNNSHNFSFKKSTIKNICQSESEDTDQYSSHEEKISKLKRIPKGVSVVMSKYNITYNTGSKQNTNVKRSYQNESDSTDKCSSGELKSSKAKIKRRYVPVIRSSQKTGGLGQNTNGKRIYQNESDSSDQHSSDESNSKYKRSHSPDSKPKIGCNCDSCTSRFPKAPLQKVCVQPTVNKYMINPRPPKIYNAANGKSGLISSTNWYDRTSFTTPLHFDEKRMPRSPPDVFQN